MPVTALLFDLDDTLLDAEVAWRGGVEHLIGARAFGLVNTDDGLVAWDEAFQLWFEPYLDGVISSEQSRTERIRHWAGAFGLPVEAGTELAWFADYVTGYRAGWTRFADVDPMLATLPSGVRLGLITNGPSDLQRAKVIALGLDSVFELVLVSGEFGVAKPDPSIFLHAAQQLGVTPAQCLMVGDNLDKDVAGALAAGMRAVWVQRPGGPEAGKVPPDELAGRFVTLSGLAALPELVA